MTLPKLLGINLGALERAYAKQPHAGHVPSLDLWANLLRVLNDSGTDYKQLPSSLRLSKRAVRMRVSSAVRKGWIVEDNSVRGKRSVRLTSRGMELGAWWNAAQNNIEERWPYRTGVLFRDNLRKSLEDLVTQFPLEHPHYPAGYGAADASITGGNGQDWRAVPREPGGTATPLPISALLSQAIVAFAMSYEQHSPVAFALSTRLLKQIPADGRALRTLGDSVGISALQRHGYLIVSGDRGNELVRLTAKGRSVSDAYDEHIREVEVSWSARFGRRTVDEARRALMAVSEGANP